MKKTARFFYFSAILLLPFGCVDTPEDPIPPRPESPTRRISVIAYNADETRLSLEGVSEAIVNIENESDWLRVSDAGMVDGTTCVNISLSEFVTNHEGMADSVLIHAGTELINFVVHQARLSEPGYPPLGFEGDFVTDWENVDKVHIYINSHDSTVVNLPWASSAATTLPISIRRDVRARDGWTMAFSFLESPDEQKFNYFGLYNKYTGILRIFYYHPNVAASGGELSFVVTPDNHQTPKFPFYHTMQYGIPASNNTVHTKKSLLDPTSVETFQFSTTPYYIQTNTNKAILAIGWTAFDIDLSAYNPGDPLYNAGERDGLSLIGSTHNESTVTLFGKMAASIEGTYDYPPTSSTSSIQGISSDLSNNLMQVATLADYVKNGNYFSALVSAASLSLSIGGNIAGGVESQVAEKDPRGKISLDLTGRISLGGYTSNTTSNEVVPIVFSYKEALKNNNKVMKGIWGLQQSPVIYVIKDLAVGDRELPGLHASKSSPPQMPRQSYNYDYIPGDPRYCFMVQFLDPSTLKINLDTEDNRFAGISNINVEWFYGVYPFRTPGHTNPHRSFMGLPLVGNLEAKKEKWWTDVALPFKNDGDNISRFDNWMLIPDLAAALRTPGEAEAGETWRWHVGSSFPYSELDLDLFPPGFPVKDHYTLYNGVLKRAAENLDSFIVDPLVSLPTVSDYSDSFGDYVVPDFVVWVMVSFEYTDGEGKTRTAAFSKRFLPDVKTVSLEEFKSKHWGELVRYRSSSTAGDAFQTIEGKDGNVGVHHKGGADQVYRILKLADYIYDNKL